MPQHLRASAHRNVPLVEPGRGPLMLSYFNLLRLQAGESHTFEPSGCETICVVLSGRADIAACAHEFKNVGRRADIWDGPADSVYCGTCPRVTVRATRDHTEVAVAGGLCAQPFAPFRVTPEEVELVEVGSAATHSRRRIFHVLGQNGAGATEHFGLTDQVTLVLASLGGALGSRGWMIAGGSIEILKNRIAESVFERSFSQRPPKPAKS